MAGNWLEKMRRTQLPGEPPQPSAAPAVPPPSSGLLVVPGELYCYDCRFSYTVKDTKCQNCGAAFEEDSEPAPSKPKPMPPTPDRSPEKGVGPNVRGPPPPPLLRGEKGATTHEDYMQATPPRVPAPGPSPPAAPPAKPAAPPPGAPAAPGSLEEIIANAPTVRMLNVTNYREANVSYLGVDNYDAGVIKIGQMQDGKPFQITLTYDYEDSCWVSKGGVRYASPELTRHYVRDVVSYARQTAEQLTARGQELTNRTGFLDAREKELTAAAKELQEMRRQAALAPPADPRLLALGKIADDLEKRAGGFLTAAEGNKEWWRQAYGSGQYAAGWQAYARASGNLIQRLVDTGVPNAQNLDVPVRKFAAAVDALSMGHPDNVKGNAPWLIAECAYTALNGVKDVNVARLLRLLATPAKSLLEGMNIDVKTAVAGASKFVSDYVPGATEKQVEAGYKLMFG